MTYDDYIILDIGKIVIKRNLDKKEYYKESENKLLPLTMEEEIIVNNIFNNCDYKNMFYSDKLNSIVFNNERLENKSYLINFFEFIEQIIPENCKQNFYNNLERLETDLNFDSNFLEIDDNDAPYVKAGGYNVKDNKLTIYKLDLKKIFEIAKKTDNPETFFWKHINQTVLHELLHMASSKYDHQTGIALCGFDTYPSDDAGECNRGLTEGLTEVLSFVGVPGTIEVSSGYYIECLFINQLSLVIQRETILESYFANKGIKELKSQLNTLIDNEEMATVLFRKIEDNFYLRGVDCKQTIMSSIQSNLIQYFRIKLLNDFNNGVDQDVILKHISVYESMLITKDVLTLIQKNPENYLGLDYSIMQFNQLKKEIMDLISDRQLSSQKASIKI